MEDCGICEQRSAIIVVNFVVEWRRMNDQVQRVKVRMAENLYYELRWQGLRCARSCLHQGTILADTLERDAGRHYHCDVDDLIQCEMAMGIKLQPEILQVGQTR